MKCAYCKNRIHDGQSFKTENSLMMHIKCYNEKALITNTFENFVAFGKLDWLKKCVSCNSVIKVQNHHIIPVFWQGGDRKNLDNDETIPLCHRCHLYMSPMLRHVSNNYNAYSINEAEKIVDSLNKNTKHRFKVETTKIVYKTVPEKTFVTISLEGRSVKKL